MTEEKKTVLGLLKSENEQKPKELKSEEQKPQEEGEQKMLDDFNITIATPHSYDTIYKSWFASYEMLIKPRNVHMYFNPSLPLDVNRNECVQMAKDNGSEYLLFLDHDNLIDHEILIRMLQYNLPIVGSLYFERKYPHLPVMYSFPDTDKLGTVQVVYDYPKGLLEVGVLGLGCTLFKMEVFDKLDTWFSYEYEGHTWGTEDIAFFYRVRDAGFKVHMDTEHTVKHVTTYEVEEADWLRHKDAYLEKVNTKAKELGTDSVFLNKSTLEMEASRYEKEEGLDESKE